MSPNVSIMNAGLAGSSVRAGLFTQAGLWGGAEACEKHDHDTLEGRRLVELNRRVLQLTEFRGDCIEAFDPAFARHSESRAADTDPAPFLEFLDECVQHQPCVWNDARLWLTLPVWAKWTSLDNVRLVHLTRELDQVWLSITIRRQVQARDCVRRYVEGIDSWGLAADERLATAQAHP